MKKVVRVIKKRDGGYRISGAAKMNFCEALFYMFRNLFKRRVFTDSVISGEVVFEGKTEEECMDYIRSLPNPPKLIEVDASLDL